MPAGEFDLSRYRHLMDGALNVLKNEFSGLRTGRASAGLVDNISVDVYGTRMPICQLATVSVPEPRMIFIQVWDRSQVDAVVKAIRESDIGLNPVVEGASMRLPIPDLNEDRRRELVKIAHKYAEQARVAVRHVRREAMDHLKTMEKNHQMSQDEHHAWADEVQKLTDSSVSSIDSLLAAKEADVMRI